MICEAIRERLDEYVDGLLERPAQEEVRRHLEECPACAGEERELRRLMASARALPHELAPSHDLWPAIGRRLGTKRARGGWARGAGWWGGLAAAAALALVVALLPLRPRRPIALPASDSQSGDAARAAYEGVTPALEDEFARAEMALLVALETRSGRLPSESRARVEASLRVIDKALGEIRAELRKQPTDPHLNLLLSSVHQKKVDVLRTVVRLTT
jgi:anti-sigma-K factor RskA